MMSVLCSLVSTAEKSINAGLRPLKSFKLNNLRRKSLYGELLTAHWVRNHCFTQLT